MFTVTRNLFAAPLLAVLLIPGAIARADYLSISVPLNSQYAGNNVGKVVAEANNGSSAVDGVLPGQIRLTYTVNPVPAYTQNGTNVGFTTAVFHSDLPISPSQVTGPSGWLVDAPVFPAGVASGGVGPSGASGWEIVAPNSASAASKVVVLLSGLGTSATLDHLLFSGASPGSMSVPPSTFSGAVAFPGVGTVSTDSVFGSPVASAPEPGSLALTLVGMAAAAVTTAVRRRVIIRR